ncbi:MAG: hypothetical protein V4587_09725 [Acidobacteriota bacterium]
MSDQPSQSAVYPAYIQLQSIRGEQFADPAAPGLAGRLLTCVGYGQQGAELALAMIIAGGTFLGIDPSTEHLKAAVRNGSCDFMVNTLDESLRVLKNEVRKKKALSVGLLAEPSAILPAMVERGVQPDLVADCAPSASASVPPYSPALLTFVERGAIQFIRPTATVPGSDDSLQVHWTAASLTGLRRMDQLAFQQLPADDSIRRGWLQHAPAYFHRQRPLQRVLNMRQQELDRLKLAFQNALAAGEIQSPATLAWQAPDGTELSIAL